VSWQRKREATGSRHAGAVEPTAVISIGNSTS
jgi:hypothetical protein